MRESHCLCGGSTIPYTKGSSRRAQTLLHYSKLPCKAQSDIDNQPTSEANQAAKPTNQIDAKPSTNQLNRLNQLGHALF